MLLAWPAQAAQTASARPAFQAMPYKITTFALVHLLSTTTRRYETHVFSMPIRLQKKMSTPWKDMWAGEALRLRVLRLLWLFHQGLACRALRCCQRSWQFKRYFTCSSSTQTFHTSSSSSSTHSQVIRYYRDWLSFLFWWRNTFQNWNSFVYFIVKRKGDHWEVHPSRLYFFDLWRRI